MDEADTLEDELLSHAELHLRNSRMKKLGIRPPKFKTKDDTWAKWIEDEAMPRFMSYQATLPDIHDVSDLHTIREIKSVERLIENLYRVSVALPRGKWVYDGYSERRYDEGDVIFRPVYVAGYGNNLLWRNGRKFLLMSATILAPEVMAGELGLTLDNRSFDTVEVPSVFPAENRPVHVVPVADMAFTKLDESKPLMARAVYGVIKRHPDERILVHCVSYSLASYLHKTVLDLAANDSSRGHVRLYLTYTSSSEKESVLTSYKVNEGSVLFAPSMDRGIDLPDDLCRVQVIAKVPYPNTSDKRINVRLHSPGGQNWYTMHTIRTIVQMAGRAVRHREDYAVTYILDSQFGENIWRNNSRMFPKYFKDALNFRFNPRLITHV
jgi:Rad3-related DNA helicase